MEKRKEIEQAIQEMETKRVSLGDAAVDAALVGLYRKLSTLDDHTETPGSERTGERRVVTVLFCDVAGSTALAESMDPEAWTRIMNEAFEYLIEPVERYGGTVARLMGDAILAFFGAPTAHEDDPQRAILAGLAIVENIQPYREKLRKEKEIDFNVRVGINTGLAVVGDVGSETAGEYTAMGDAVNLAARMEQTASPGSVQIAQDTYALVAPLFDVKELGGIQVKGKRVPVLAYQVLGSKANPGSLRGLSDQGISSPLVGRESELESARKAIDHLLVGQGGILFIQGEAGVGKSRLLAELKNHPVIKNSQLIWLEGHTLSFSQSISYWPFQEILRSYAGINEGDGEAEVWSKLEFSIGELFQDETAEILPYLASLLSVEVSNDYAERVKYLDGEALGRQVYRASRRFFQSLAEQVPLALVFEDLHWMDASSAGLLEHLLPLVKQVPLLMYILSRPDRDSSAAKLLDIAEEQYGDRLTEVRILPLSPNDSRYLVQNLLEIDGLPEQTRVMILNKADGNPFYLEEIVRDLIENGALVQDTSTGRWQATQQIEKVTVPDTIQGLLIARIDRLDKNLKRVVRRAAVIGRTFLYRILDVVLEDEHELEKQLDKLQIAELIKEKQRVPELEYIFKHALAQEAAYEGILLQERQELHGRVGATIESLFADRLDEFYGLLAHHYSAAEIWDKAQEYLFKAGDQAGSMAADTEALAHYHQAMEAYARARGNDWDPIERAQLERKIGQALSRQGEHDQARAYLENSLSLLGITLSKSRWGTRLALLQALLTQITHRLLPRKILFNMGGKPDPVAEEIFLSSQALGFVELTANAERYMLLALKALNTSENAGYAYGSAYLASSLGVAAALIGIPKISDTYFRLSAFYTEQIDPFHPVFQLEFGLAAKYNMLGDWNKSLFHATQGAEIAQMDGDLRDWGQIMALVGFSYWALGKYEQAIEAGQETLQFSEESSDQQVISSSLLLLGTCQRRIGLVAESIRSFQRTLIITEELPDYVRHVGASGWMGRSYLAQGDVAQALITMEDGQELFDAKGGNLPGYAYLGNGLAEAYLTMAKELEGHKRQFWLNKARSAIQATIKKTKGRSTLPETYLFRGRYDWLLEKPGSAKKWWMRALNLAEDMGMRYEEAMIHFEIGKRLSDRVHLLSAESILEEIGAEFDLAKAREVLANLDDG